MAIIYSYPTSTVKGTDRIIASDMTVTGNPTININVNGIADYILALLGFGSGTPGTMPVWVTNQELGDSYIKQVATPTPLTTHTESAEFVTGKVLTVDSTMIVNGVEDHNNLETHNGIVTFNNQVDFGDLTALNVNSVNMWSKFRVYGELIDSSGLGSPGGLGQILSSTVTGVEWIDGLPSGLEYRGTWDANLNTSVDGPLASGVGTQGYYYIVSEAGATNLDGFNSWQVGDWAIFSSANTWQEIDNSAIFSGAGTPNVMTKWTGPSALGDSQTTDDGTNISMVAAGLLELEGTANGITLTAGGSGIVTGSPTTFNSIVNLANQTTLTGSLTDAFVSTGAAGQVLSSTGAGQVQWINASAAAGSLQGSGTLNQVAKWTPSGLELGDSSIADDSNTVTMNPAVSVNITSNANLTGVSNIYGTAGGSDRFDSVCDFQDDIKLSSALVDSLGLSGTSGQVLSTNGSQTEWTNPLTLTDGSQELTVSVDPFEMSQLSSVPKVVIPAQGVGTVIEILSVAFKYDYATTVYDFTSYLVVCPSGSVGNTDTYQAVFKQAFINGVGDIYQGNEQGQFTFAGKLLQDNTAMVFSTPGIDPTQGDGNMRLNVRYRVLDISTWTVV